jgi:hypothetical protein
MFVKRFQQILLSAHTFARNDACGVGFSGRFLAGKFFQSRNPTPNLTAAF